MRKIIIYSLIFIFTLATPLSAIQAASFNPNMILTDHDLTDYTSMDSQEIKSFLVDKGGTLGTMADTNLRMYIYQIIYNVAHFYKINPKYILVLLQKEQSLVTDDSPTQGQLNWATGYGCPDGSSCNEKYKGIANQIDWGAGGIRYYLEHPNEFTYQTGQTYTIDDQQVTMANDATRALYTYTPHLHGNEMLSKIWQEWFSLEYPDGTLLQNANDGGVWIIQNGKRRPFLSKSAFASRYSFNKLIAVKQSELEKYDIGDPIKYANYSLLETPDEKIYLLEDDKLRPIVSDEAFRLLGFNPEEITKVEVDEITSYQTGEPIDITSSYPTGALLQDKTTGGVYFVKNGIKQPLWSRTLLNLYYSDKKITPVAPEELTNYETGAPISLKDGELVKAKGNPQVYVISNNLRRPINSAEVFESLGYKWSNVLEIEENVLNLHDLGSEVVINQ